MEEQRHLQAQEDELCKQEAMMMYYGWKILWMMNSWAQAGELREYS